MSCPKRVLSRSRSSVLLSATRWRETFSECEVAAHSKKTEVSMTRRGGRSGGHGAALAIALCVGTLAAVASVVPAQAAVVRAALAPGSINNVLVIQLENESFSQT